MLRERQEDLCSDSLAAVVLMGSNRTNGAAHAIGTCKTAGERMCVMHLMPVLG